MAFADAKIRFLEKPRHEAYGTVAIAGTGAGPTWRLYVND
jgi:hypothetical protein